ncbi:MAG: hypothetical protein JW727_02305 [Candidatus Aenigmarchaeota archaeon]|nr:hypothetical protein [Candidatus Aenigmarchaeota archaeon]
MIKFTKNLTKKLGSPEVFLSVLLALTFTYLISSEILTIGPEAAYWLYGSFIEGFITFLALFGTFFIFKISEIKERQKSWWVDVVKITQSYRPQNKKVDLLKILAKMSKQKNDPEIKRFLKGWIDLHSYLKTTESELKDTVQKLFVWIVGLILISVLGIILTENKFCNASLFYGLSVNSLLVVFSIMLGSIILLTATDFLRKML